MIKMDQLACFVAVPHYVRLDWNIWLVFSHLYVAMMSLYILVNAGSIGI